MKTQFGNYELEQERYNLLLHELRGMGYAVLDIHDVLFADWHEGQEHEDWLNEASIDEIVSWFSSVHNEVVLEDDFEIE